jgi:TRAP-type C4-dicarboxylate transport system permease small subunit
MTDSDRPTAGNSPSSGPPPATFSRPRPAWASAYDRVLRFTFISAMTLTLTAITLLIGLDVILRVFFSIPIRGTHDLVGLGLLLTFVCSLPYSWRGNYHVRMDMLYNGFSPTIRMTIDVFAGIAAASFAMLLAYQAARYIPHLIRVNSSSVTLGVPYWPFAIGILISSVLFTLSVIQETFLTITRRTGNA